MSEGLYTSVQVGNYLILKYGRIGFVKLQKMVFCAHGWHLALRDKPLICEKVEAWQSGPMYPSIYHKRDSLPSNLPIPSIEEADLRRIEDSSIRDYLDAIYKRYDVYNAFDLNCITQAEGTPWFQVTEKYLTGDEQFPRHLFIPDDLIKEHYKLLIEDEKVRKLKKARAGAS